MMRLPVARPKTVFESRDVSAFNPQEPAAKPELRRLRPGPMRPPLGLPVHRSVVPEGGEAPEVLPDLAKETEGAPQFARMTADPFLDPQTREAINAVKRPVLVIAGFATEAVVLDAALSALENDYRVQVPVDACGGMSARTEDAALRQIEAAGGVTTSVVSLVTAMAPDFAREPGRNTFAALQALRLA